MNLLKSDSTSEKKNRVRYEKLDLIRGITLISMIAYHTCWDLVWLYGKPWAWYPKLPGYVWQQSICWTFILLSGFCWSMGKRRWKRGLQVLLSSCLVSAVTILAMPEDPIYFGVLTFMGSAMLLMIPLEKLTARIKPIPGLIICGVLFFLIRNIGSHWFGFEKMYIHQVPDSLYANWFTTWLGFPFDGFYSTDYFGVLPWMPLFVAGYFLYRLLKDHDRLSHFQGKANVDPVSKVIRFAGRHTLIFYLLHQVIIYIILYLLFNHM